MDVWIKLLSLHLYYYALHGKLGEVGGSKIKINYYLYVYDVVYGIELNKEANELKRRPHSNMRPLLLKNTDKE